MNMLDDFIAEYLQISRIVETNQKDDVLNKLSTFFEYTRIKDKQKAIDFEKKLQKAINATLQICITGERLAGKSSLINEILESQIIPKNKSLNFVLQYANIPYIKIHKDNKIITQDINALLLIHKCDFVEIFLNKEILKNVTIIESNGESNGEFDTTKQYDFHIYINNANNGLIFPKKCDLMLINTSYQTELNKLKESDIKNQHYRLMDINNLVFNQDSTPIIPVSIINIKDSKNAISRIFNDKILPQAKLSKDKKIKDTIYNLAKETIDSYNELIQSYENLISIMQKHNFIEYAKHIHLEIQTTLEDILKTFAKDFQAIKEVFWQNIHYNKVDVVTKDNILKVKKIKKKLLYSININAIRNTLFNDDNNIYARQYRANIYRLSKLKDFISSSIQSRREDFIGDIKIWQIEIQNFSKTTTFISQIHIDNLVHFSLKIYDNIVNIFILLTSQIILDLYSQILKIEIIIENKTKLLIEFIALKLNQELAQITDKPNKSHIQEIINNAINDYLLKDISTLNIDALNSTAVEIERTKSLKCEQINKIIDDIKNLKIDINNLLNNLQR